MHFSGPFDRCVELFLSRSQTRIPLIQREMGTEIVNKQEIAPVSINNPDEGMSWVVFNAEGILMSAHQIDVLQN
jgi:hypothetical protein